MLLIEAIFCVLGVLGHRGFTILLSDGGGSCDAGGQCKTNKGFDGLQLELLFVKHLW